MPYFKEELEKERSGKVEYVALQIGSKITNDPTTVVSCFRNHMGGVNDMLTRTKATLMAAMDMGIQWEKLSRSPTILVEETGELKLGPIILEEMIRQKKTSGSEPWVVE